jgi:large subunit ribosomal protein L10
LAKAKRPPQTKKKLGGPRVGEGGPRQSKVTAVADVQERLQASSAVVLTEYRGMTVHELAELRASLREAGAEYKVYKNTLATIAARNAGLEELTGALDGPTAFAFVKGDPVPVAKRLSDFAKRVPTLVLKGGVLEGRVLSLKEVTALSSLDSREVMLAKAAGLFLSPIQKLANLFAAPLNQLGSLMAQLRDKMPAEAGPLPEQPAAVTETVEAAAPAADPVEPAAATEDVEPAAATEDVEPAAPSPVDAVQDDPAVEASQIEATPTEEAPQAEDQPAKDQ